MLQAGAADQDGDAGVFQVLERLEAGAAFHAQLDAAVDHDNAPEVVAHLLEGEQEIHHQLAAEHVVARADHVGSEEDQVLLSGRGRTGGHGILSARTQACGL